MQEEGSHELIRELFAEFIRGELEKVLEAAPSDKSRVLKAESLLAIANIDLANFREQAKVWKARYDRAIYIIDTEWRPKLEAAELRAKNAESRSEKAEQHASQLQQQVNALQIQIATPISLFPVLAPDSFTHSCACRWDRSAAHTTIGEAAPHLKPCAGHGVYGDWRASEARREVFKKIGEEFGKHRNLLNCMTFEELVGQISEEMSK